MSSPQFRISLILCMIVFCFKTCNAKGTCENTFKYIGCTGPKRYLCYIETLVSEYVNLTEGTKLITVGQLN